MAVRVLHTSDWHLGGQLDGVSRGDEHRRFLAWLTVAITEQSVDVLVVAGDVFDQANPPAEAQRDYYAFLAGLRDTPLRQAIIVAGNHDSAARLEAPRELLGALNVQVVGRADGAERQEDLLCPITGPEGVELVALAVPFVHEYRLGIRTTGLSSTEVAAAFADRFGALYSDLADLASERWPGVPLIATGHLTAGAYTRDDFPVDVHLVGSIGGLPDSVFDPRLRYVALGHIHRMMHVGSSAAWYCGTPVPTQMTEGGAGRRVLLLDVEPGKGAIRPTPLAVPLSRALVELVGDVDGVCADVAGLVWSEPLPPMVRARVEVDGYDPAVERRVHQAMDKAFGDATDGGRPLLLGVHQERAQQADTSADEAQSPPLRDLDPEDVFRRLCAYRNTTVDDALLTAFRQVLAGGDPS